MSGLLLVNPRAGGARPSAHELGEEAVRRGLSVRLLEPGEDAIAIAREAEAAALGVAGGDGSLAPVAAVAIERDLPFVCVPFGTRNHFARDLGLDRDDPVGALDAFAGPERRVDVGRAGERVFLNNVSFGLYARLVHRREHHRRRSEALARLRAIGMLARHPQRLVVSLDGTPVAARVVLVANNRYTLELFSLGERERLDDGLLHLYAADGLLPGSWHERTAERFTLDSSAGRLTGALDGEPVELEKPVELASAPGALRVLVPPESGRESGRVVRERQLRRGR